MIVKNDKEISSKKLNFKYVIVYISITICYLLYDNTKILTTYIENFERIQISQQTLFVFGLLLLLLAWYTFKQLLQVKVNSYLLKIGMIYIYCLFFATCFNKNSSDAYVDVVKSIAWVLILYTGYYIGYRNTLFAGNVIAKWMLSFSLPFICLYLIYRYYFQGIISGDAFFNLIVLLPFVLMLNNKLIKRILIIFFICMIIISLKRSILLALVFSLVTYYIVTKKHHVTYKIIISLYVVLLIIVFQLFLSNVESIPILNRFMSLGDDGGSGRDIIYFNLWTTFLSGSFSQQFLGNGINSTLDAIGFYAHNDFLQLLLDFGIVGGCLYLLIVRAAILDLRLLAKYKYRYLNCYGTLCATFSLIFFLSLFNCMIYHAYYLLVMMFCVGLNMGMINRKNVI